MRFYFCPMKLLSIHQRDFKDVKSETSLLLGATASIITVALAVYIYAALLA